VQVIAAVVDRQEEGLVARIPRDGVEVDHCVERPAAPDPLIERCAAQLTIARGARGGQRRAVDLEPERVRAFDGDTNGRDVANRDTVDPRNIP